MANPRRETGADRYDSLYVSPHEDDALFGCAGRLLSDRQEGLRTLVVVVFSSGASLEAEQALARLGADRVRLGLSAAPERNDYYRTYSAAVFGRHSEDERLLPGLAEQLLELVLRTRARNVYLPLGAGLHIDHRLCHEAGLRALEDVTGRNVFFYEERPEALLAGSVGMRLAEIGARLPPAATSIGGKAGASRVLAAFSFAPHVRSSTSGLVERARCLPPLLRKWRESRRWQPLRAFGLRLQPSLSRLDGQLGERVVSVLGDCEARVQALFGSRDRLERRARDYGRRLGAASGYAERLWLLLPPRDEGGVAILPRAGSQAVS